VGEERKFEVDRQAADQIVGAQRVRGGGYLASDDVLALLRAYGLPTLQSRLACTRAEAASIAVELGLPVVMKIVSPQVVHKTDVGGVALDLRTAEEVERAYDAMLARVQRKVPAAEITGVVVEQYVRGGRETIIGMTHDPSFGPVLMFGLGGIYVEALHDVAFRIQPVSDIDAREMVRSIRGVKLLEGVRGEPPADLAAVEEAIQRVSQLVGDYPEIAELDINPFVVFARGGVAVDARIRIADGMPEGGHSGEQDNGEAPPEPALAGAAAS
jgi:acetyltransferase